MINYLIIGFFIGTLMKNIGALALPDLTDQSLTSRMPRPNILA
jgi:hypothetical protein